MDTYIYSFSFSSFYRDKLHFFLFYLYFPLFSPFPLLFSDYLNVSFFLLDPLFISSIFHLFVNNLYFSFPFTDTFVDYFSFFPFLLYWYSLFIFYVHTFPSLSFPLSHLFHQHIPTTEAKKCVCFCQENDEWVNMFTRLRFFITLQPFSWLFCWWFLFSLPVALFPSTFLPFCPLYSCSFLPFSLFGLF